MENIFMTNVDIIRRLSIRYGVGELVEVEMSPNSIQPHWHAVLQQIARRTKDDVQVKIDYWLNDRGHSHPLLSRFMTPGFEYAPQENDQLFAVVIPVLKPYFWTDDPVNPTELQIQSLQFQLDIHNGTQKLAPSIQTGIRLHLATAQMELIG